MIILGLYVHLNYVQLSLFVENSFVKESSFILEERELNIKLPDLVAQICGDLVPDCIALHRGPSGFTSLRVSLAFVEGLSLGWRSKLFTPTHFELLIFACQIENGLIVIDHKGAVLPGVRVTEGVMGIVEPYSLDQAIFQKAFLTSSIEGVNLSKSLVEMAIPHKNRWRDTYFIEPDYGILPTYKEKKDQ